MAVLWLSGHTSAKEDSDMLRTNYDGDSSVVDPEYLLNPCSHKILGRPFSFRCCKLYKILYLLLDLNSVGVELGMRS